MGWNGVDSRVLRLDLLGGSERSRQSLAALFHGAAKGEGLIVNETVAEAVLVDLDGAGALEEWAAYRGRYAHRPAILISEGEPVADAPDQVIKKPIEIGALSAAIRAIRDHLERLDEEEANFNRVFDGGLEGTIPPVLHVRAPQPEFSESRDEAVVEEPEGDVEATVTVAADPETPSALVPGGTSPTTVAAKGSEVEECCDLLADVDLLDPAQIKELLLPLSGRVLGGLKKVAAKALETGILKGVLLGKMFIIFCPGDHRVVSNASRSQLRQVLGRVFPAETIRMGTISPQVLEDLEKGGRVRSQWSEFDAFLWQAALWTYRGRLPAGTVPTQKIYLDHWPNLTRLAEVPHGLRIAALLCRQPMTLGFTAETLRIPQRYVFAFYSAAHTIGLAGTAKRSVDDLVDAQTIQAHAERGIFDSALSRLKDFVAEGITGEESA